MQEWLCLWGHSKTIIFAFFLSTLAEVVLFAEVEVKLEPELVCAVTYIPDTEDCAWAN